MTSLVMVLTFAVISGFGASVASADETDGVYKVELITTGSHDGNPMLENGQQATLYFEYNSNAQGKTVTFDLPQAGSPDYTFNPAISTDCEGANVPSGNEAIKCIGFQDDGTLTITFEDDFDNTGGVFSLNFTPDGIDDNHLSELDWAIESEDQSPLTVIVAGDKDDFAPSTDSFGKTRTDGASFDLDDYIDFDGETAAAKTDADFDDLAVAYTVHLVKTEPGTYTVADVPEEPLVLDDDSFVCAITTWDDEGLNSNDPAACADSGTVTDGAYLVDLDLTADNAVPAEITISYTAHVDKDQLLDEINAWLGGDGSGIDPATFQITPENAATLNGENQQSVATTLTWDKQGVSLGENSKTVAPTALGSCVDTSTEQVDASQCQGTELTYTLTYYSNEADAGSITVTDTLPAGMSFDEEEFDVEQTTWNTTYPYDANEPENFTRNADVTGTPETATADVPIPAGPAKTVITYTATIDDVDALEDELQKQYDALGASSGDLSTSLQNGATFDRGDGTCNGTCTVSKSVAVTATKTAGVTPSSAFGKTVDWTRKIVTGNDDGDIVAPIEATYTLTADLDGIDGDADDIVIADTLPDGMSWNDDSIALDPGSSGALTLVKEQTCSTTTAKDYGAQTDPGDYCLDGQTLLINVGHDAATNADITATATISSVANLGGAPAGDAQPDGTQKYGFNNGASFYYGADNGPQNKDAYSELFVRPTTEADDGFNVPAIFDKTTENADGEVHVDPNEATPITYTFTVGAGNGIDARTSTITDYIDATVFDLGEDLTGVSVGGTYDGQPLDADDFALSQDADGNLQITLSDSGVQVVDARGADKQWVVSITLTTVELAARQTLTIYNKAILTGTDGQPTFNSEVQTSATTYGSEYETRKLVYDANATTGSPWVSGINSDLNPDRTLADNPYVYRIDFVAHGNYGERGAHPSDIVDVLPQCAHFQGFIAPAVVGTDGFDDAVQNASDTSTQDIGGNLAASYSDGIVTLGIADGKSSFQRDPGSGTYSVSFAVRVTCTGSDDVVNSITGGSQAVIHPLTYAVGDYTWIDSDRDGIQGSDEAVLPGVTVELLDGDGNPVQDADGEPVQTTTDADGRYLFDNLPAGTYQVRFTLTDEQAERYVFTTVDSTAVETGVDADEVDSDGTPDETNPAVAVTEPFTLDDSNEALTTDYTDQEFRATQGIDPTWDAGVVEKSYAVGDFTWVDSDRDGIQDPDEEVLPGVTVSITDAEGAPVTDVHGNEVPSTVTDAEGRYLFDDLPAGDYVITFTLTDEQAKKYQFTSLDSGDDDAADSDADPATGTTVLISLNDDNAALTTDYDREFDATQGVDPTWDAGVNLKSVSVGDYVWVDENRDGVQDEGEPGIAGVTLCLVGPDGEPVTNVYGDPVGPVVTDENGQYSFDDLPALDGDQTYTVCIDRDTSAEALAPYVPTQEGGSEDWGEDSSTWTSSTEPGDLHEDGMRDPTLDFGFITKSYAVGDYVWVDSNKDGLQGSDEPVLEGVTVDLLDRDGTVVATTSTDTAGRYLFDNLPAGTYQVRFTLTAEQSAQYRFTTADAGDDAADSDADVVTGLTAPFVLDDSNAALTTDYDRELGATQGIDPTWDAGVIEIEQEVVDPGADSDNQEGNEAPATDVDNGTPDSDPGSDPGAAGTLPLTGIHNGPGQVAAGLILVLGGVFLLLLGAWRKRLN